MSKLLLAFSVAALFYGDCTFGMDNDENELYENPWKDKPSESQNAKSQTAQSKDELLELQREKIAKYESALQKLNQQLREEREINKLAEVKIEKLQQKLENVKIENRIQKLDKNDENLASDSKQDPKPLTRLERQKRQLRQLNAEFKTNQEENEKLRKEFKRTDKNPDNGSKKVKKMVEQIEQRSRPSFGIEVNHKPANLVLGKKNKQLFDKETTNDIDWESTPSASILEQQEIQTLNQKREEANKVIDELKQQLATAKLHRIYEKQINESKFNLKKSDTIKNEKYVSSQKKQTTPANTGFSFGKTATALPVDLYNSNKIQYYNDWGFNPKNTHLEAAKADTTNSAQAQLFEAIEKGNLSDVINTIKNGANINGQDENGNTPMYIAAINGNISIVEYLVQHGADVNKSGNDGWTPLHGASHNGHLEIVKFLVKNGADINRKTTISERTPLYIAKLNQHQDIIDYLKSKGAK